MDKNTFAGYSYTLAIILKKLYIFIFTIILLAFSAHPTCAKTREDKDLLCDSVLRQIFNYTKTVDTTGINQACTYAYTKMQMHTHRRNVTLMLIPSMYAISYGAGRHFIGEYYNKITAGSTNWLYNRRLLNISTIPHRRNTMSGILPLMTPDVYGENLFQNNILSPFNRSNRKYYTYNVTPLPFGNAQVCAYPKLKNTQTVEAKAIVSTKTGKISMVDFEGEFDMTRFFVSIVMGTGGYKSLFPINCNIRANFKFLGNNITGMLNTYYNLPKMLPDTLDNVADTALMAKVRPIPLNKAETALYANYFQQKTQKDSISDTKAKEKTHDFVKDVLWDIIGDNVLNDFTQDLGDKNQGYVRLSPVLNPLYMEYTPRKGFIYKFDIRGSYAFDENYQLAVRARASYSFKLRQLYLSIPATFRYNARHNGYIEMEMGSGNRINSSVIARNLLGINEKTDSIYHLSESDITEFKDNYLRITNHWMFNSNLSLDVGVVSHRRKATFPEFYQSFGYPVEYLSVAPHVGVSWMPWGQKGPLLTANYEQSIHGFLGANIPYARIETDSKCIIRAGKRKLYSLRTGAGFYLMRGRNWNFIDYSNFCDNYIPGGWNDDWSGSFELLDASWYNSSEFYVRSNFTYEAPMLLAAWLPLVGRYIEAERLYSSALVAKRLCPYTEWGYGCTTRLVSIGVFAAFRHAKYNGFGFKFEFELFRHW